MGAADCHVADGGGCGFTGAAVSEHAKDRSLERGPVEDAKLGKGAVAMMEKGESLVLRCWSEWMRRW